MDQPNTSIAGIVAVALVSKLIDALVAKGALTDAEVAEMLASAAADFKADSRALAEPAETFLRREFQKRSK